MSNTLQKYLNRAVGVLEKYGIIPKGGEESQLSGLLEEVVSVDEARVVAVAKTIRYMGTFNELVRDKVGEMNIADRYNQITQMFDSIREDSKTLLGQVEDGKIDWREKAQNIWMKLWRGTPHERFEKIKDTYENVSKDTKKQLDNENDILGAYVDFRFALKDAEILSREVLKTQEDNLETAKANFREATDKFEKYQEDDAQKQRLRLSRDEAQRLFEQEDKKYQLIKDVTENLSIGYNVGETLVAKLKQTHDVKDQVYRRSITFFTTNEHVFTTLDAVYTSQHGLHETTQTLEAMKQGANKGLEDIVELGRELEKAAVQAGYGSTLSPQSVQKLVDSVVAYQLESGQMIEQLRIESAENAKQITAIVDDGKKKCQQAILNYTKPNVIEGQATVVA